MKLRHIITAAVLISFALMASSCVTTVTTTTLPDGTVVKVESKGPDAASVNAASNLAGVAAGLMIHADK